MITVSVANYLSTYEQSSSQMRGHIGVDNEMRVCFQCESEVDVTVEHVFWSMGVVQRSDLIKIVCGIIYASIRM